MKPIIHIPAALSAAIEAHSAESYPQEACGLLCGVEQRRGVMVITEAIPSNNLAKNPHTAFLLDPATQFLAQKTARFKGQKIVGVYHSHPGGQAIPSLIDKKNATQPNFLWMITAFHPTKNREMRCYITLPEGNDFLEVGIKITEPRACPQLTLLSILGLFWLQIFSFFLK